MAYKLSLDTNLNIISKNCLLTFLNDTFVVVVVDIVEHLDRFRFTCITFWHDVCSDEEIDK